MIIRKNISCLFLFCLLANVDAFAQENDQYPNVSGQALFQLKFDRALSSNKEGIPPNNVRVDIEPDFSLNFNKNWSVKTNWKIQPITKRDQNNPERYRAILREDRGFTLKDEGLIVEQLKGQFENEDMRFFFGKFNPEFGSAFKKEKRIGVFTTDFTKDYELRERVGLGGSALLENSEITVSAFFNDVSGLSDSAVNKRGREKSSNGVAGNTSTLSSFAIAMKGDNLFGVNDLFYNVGYRNLNVENIPGRDNEKGYVGGIEYLYPLGLNTSIIPFLEMAKISNMSGEVDRNALYTTAAVIAKYSSWTASIAHIARDIRQKNFMGNMKDHQLQYSVGYKFSNNIALDISRSSFKEDGYHANLVGAMLSYLYKF